MVEYIEVQGLGKIRVMRRKGARTIRLSLSQNGEVRLSVPYRVSLADGLKFLNEKRDWIEQNAGIPSILEDGARIGKAHTLKIGTSFSTKSQTIIGQSTVIVQLPKGITEAEAQKKLIAAARKILTKESEALLPQRLAQLANKFGYSYASCSINQLKSRWGSCSNRNDIVLNAYLIQLPWELIDYVLLHELAHTKHHDHSQAFWTTVETTLSDYHRRRKLLKKFPTSVFDTREIESRMQ
jgi:predicted metal-dependent hydrolase